LIGWSGALNGKPHLGTFLNRLKQVGPAEGFLILWAVLIVSLVLQLLDLSIVRLFEGYWDRPPGSWLAHLLRKWHVWRQRQLWAKVRLDRPIKEEERERAIWLLRHLYPAEERIMPTRLGNVLRAAEDRAGQPYGLQTVVIWPHLFPLLSDKVSDIVVDERNQLDMAVRLCFAFLLAGIGFAGILMWQLGYANMPSDRWRWLVVPAVSLALSLLSYRGALNAALLYGVGLETAFALHRFDMLAAMHLPLPENHKVERKANSNLSELFQYGRGAIKPRQLITYRHPSEHQDKPSNQAAADSAQPGSVAAS
jgi:hypothetical protein